MPPLFRYVLEMLHEKEISPLAQLGVQFGPFTVNDVVKWYEK